MEPLSEWYRANNEAYQGIFIDEHHIGQWQGAMRPQLGQDRDQVGFMVMSQKSNFELAHQSPLSALCFPFEFSDAIHDSP